MQVVVAFVIRDQHVDVSVRHSLTSRNCTNHGTRSRGYSREHVLPRLALPTAQQVAHIGSTVQLPVDIPTFTQASELIM